MLSHADLAGLAAEAYSGPQSIQLADDVSACVTLHGDEMVAAVPGTHADNPLDWIRDLSVLPYWFGGIGPCHAGFGAAGMMLWPHVDAMLLPSKRVVFTGHSLGGAVALVLAALHAANGRPRCRVVVFGAPRVSFILNSIFGGLVRRALEAVEYRENGDPVPDVPTGWLFRHPTWGHMIGAPEPEPLANHAIAKYMADLKE